MLRFKGQLIYRLVTLGSFPGPCHLNQLLYPVESVLNLLTLFRMKCHVHSLSFKSERVWNFEISYCWFVPDVMAAMLVVSRLGTKLHFHVNFFFFIVLTFNMATWSGGSKRRICRVSIT